MNMMNMMNIEPVVVGYDFLHQVSDYLCGYTPLSHLRDWQVHMRLSSMCNSAEIGFLNFFEGIYAEFTDMRDSQVQSVKDAALPLFRKRLHQAICGHYGEQGVTGTLGQLINVEVRDDPNA